MFRSDSGADVHTLTRRVLFPSLEVPEGFRRAGHKVTLAALTRLQQVWADSTLYGNSFTLFRDNSTDRFE